MDNRKFFRNAALAFGLLATGSSFATETSATAPVANTPAQHEAAHAEMKAKMDKMTPEQREAYRADMKARMDKMTPEQRAEVKEKMHDKMAAHDHNAKGEGHEHGEMNHEHMHAHDMHGAGGMPAR